jgi:phage-related protein
MLRIDLGRVEGFIHELDDTSQRKVIFLLRMLEEGSLPFLPSPHGEKVEKDIYALRISSRTNPRIYYTVHHGCAHMITGIYKKSSKIPISTLMLCRACVAKLHRS